MSKARLCVLYGSQTGTAQDVAELLWRESKKMDFAGPVLPLDEYDFKKLINEKLVVFVCATTGQGDEPDNMKIFWRFLLRKDLPTNSLCELNFAILGLGDSGYTKFNYTAKRLQKRLLQLSANQILPLGLCDDQHDFGPSATYLPWAKDLLDALSKYSNSGKTQRLAHSPHFKWLTNLYEGVSKADCETLQWPLKNPPNIIELKDNIRVTTDDHFQDVRLLSFGYHDLTWQAGDVLVLRPWNIKEDVDNLFTLFGESSLDFQRETVVNFSVIDEEMPLPKYYQKPSSLEDIATFVWDLNAVPRQRVFELLSLNCENELEKDKLFELSQPEGLEELIKYVIRPKRTILEVLYDFPHAVSGLTVAVLFEMFNEIKPRYFSIASIPDTETLQILVAIVEYKTILSRPRKGLCTSWLKDLCRGQKIFTSVQRGTMKIPKDTNIPLVMIGPGTGIAPFRSLMLAREVKNQAMGNLFLFFGCRSKYKDFYFSKDFQRLERSGVIKCFFAFSRDQPEKRYVQHLIEEEDEVLREEIITKKGFIFVAGNSKNMPNQVKEAFVNILGSNSYVEGMIKEGRYQEETW